jgi:galactokinase/mevalonate kinase-like predicted kinase
MDKKQKVTIASLLVFSALGAGFVSAFPMGFRVLNKELTSDELKTLTEERQQLTQAIENNDYNTWKTLMEQRIEKMKSELTEDNFKQVVDRYNQMKERSQLKQQIKQAIQNKDYDTATQLRNQLSSLGGNTRGGFGYMMSW